MYFLQDSFKEMIATQTDNIARLQAQVYSLNDPNNLLFGSFQIKLVFDLQGFYMLPIIEYRGICLLHCLSEIL